MGLFKFYAIISSVIVSLHLIESSPENSCQFRGKCGEFDSAIGGVFPIPCVYRDVPKPLNNESVAQSLKSITPELFNTTNPVFCCDDRQVVDIFSQISTVHTFVQSCPSCFVNFAKIFLHMTCAPNQIDFIDVISVSNSTLETGKFQIDELTYYASEHFSDSVYDSCKDVQLSAGLKVMALLCGQWGAAQCTAQRFLNFIGNKDPSPMQINFVLTKDSVINKTNATSFYPLNPKTVSCTEAPPGYSNNTCSCSDCPAKCA